jgi:hypothetical protein
MGEEGGKPMPVAHLNDIELFYFEVGKGLPCLVMHGGLGTDHTSLHPWLDPFGRRDASCLLRPPRQRPLG